MTAASASTPATTVDVRGFPLHLRRAGEGPPVLVLHDPTTAVDAVTEARIAEGIAALRTGRTTLVVATRPALLAATDRVVHVVDGRVAATGTHAALLDDPTYRGALG